jgi:hypothetical protein
MIIVTCIKRISCCLASRKVNARSTLEAARWLEDDAVALLVLVLLHWQAGTAIGPTMVRTRAGRTIHSPPEEREGKECRGKTIIIVYSTSQHNVSPHSLSDGKVLIIKVHSDTISNSMQSEFVKIPSKSHQYYCSHAMRCEVRCGVKQDRTISRAPITADAILHKPSSRAVICCGCYPNPIP